MDIRGYIHGYACVDFRRRLHYGYYIHADSWKEHFTFHVPPVHVDYAHCAFPWFHHCKRFIFAFVHFQYYWTVKTNIALWEVS